MRIFLILLSLAVTTPFVLADEFTIQKIIIRDSKFEIIRVIEKPEEIMEARSQWLLLETIENLPNYNWTHKLDIRSDSIGGSWLYNIEGYIAKLNKRLQPMYKVPDRDKFNDIYLGL